MGKLDDILSEFDTDDFFSGRNTITEAKQQIKSLMLELVGDDKSDAAYSQPGMFEINQQNKINAVQNGLRAEIRKKIREL